MKRDSSKQRACIADWDGTLRDGCIQFDWLRYLDKHSTKNDFGHADLLFHAQRFAEGEITCKEFLSENYRILAQCMEGYRVNEIITMTNAFVEIDIKSRVLDFAFELLDIVHRKDIRTIIISNGPGVLLQAYKDFLPIDQIYATEIEVSSAGIFTDNILCRYADVVERTNLIDALKEEYDIALAFCGDTADVSLAQSAKYAFVKQKPGIVHKHSYGSGSCIRELNRSTVRFISHYV